MTRRGGRVTILELFGIKSLDEIDSIIHKLDGGLSVDTVDSGGRTLLMEATVHRKHSLMKLLLDRGADARMKGDRMWDALHFAAQNVDLRATELLVEAGADVNAADDYGNSIISTAVLNFRGDGSVIRFLRNHGADPNQANKSGISGMSLAKTISNYDILPFLTD